jgi:hypothetical protein
LNCTEPTAPAGATVAVNVSTVPDAAGDTGDTANDVLVATGPVLYAVGLVKNIAAVKVPNDSWVNPLTHFAVTSYSPACRLVPRSVAASFRINPKGRSNGSVVEKPALVVVTIGKGLSGGNVGFVPPTGPVMNTTDESAVVGHGADV